MAQTFEIVKMLQSDWQSVEIGASDYLKPRKPD